jgi:hypothetical protein
VLQHLEALPALLMGTYRVAQEMAQWGGLLPLVAVAWLSLRRPVEPVAVLLGAVFALSVAADLASDGLMDRGVPNLWLTYVLAPVQFGLLLAVVMPPRYRRIVWGFFGLLVAASFARATFDAPETFVHVLGGAFVALAAWTQPGFERYRTGVMLYCAATIPALLAMGFFAPGWSVEWLAAWGVYQAVRVSALVCVAWSILAFPRTRLEVVRNDRPRTVDAGERGLAAGHVHVSTRRGHRPAIY